MLSKSPNQSQWSGLYFSFIFPKHRVREGSRNFCGALYPVSTMYPSQVQRKREWTVEWRRKETESGAYARKMCNWTKGDAYDDVDDGDNRHNFVAGGNACPSARARTYTYAHKLCTRALWRTVIHWSTCVSRRAVSSTSSVSSSASLTTSTTSGWWWW